MKNYSLFFYGKKNMIFCIKQNIFNFLCCIDRHISWWMHIYIYCIIFAGLLVCAPPPCTRFYCERIFLPPRDFSMVSWILTKKSFRFFSAKKIFLLHNWVTFLFLRSKQNDFLHFPELQQLLFLLFHSSMWWLMCLLADSG